MRQSRQHVYGSHTCTQLRFQNLLDTSSRKNDAHFFTVASVFFQLSLHIVEDLSMRPGLAFNQALHQNKKKVIDVIFFTATSLRSLHCCRTIPHHHLHLNPPFLQPLLTDSASSKANEPMPPSFTAFGFSSSPLPQLPWEGTKNGVVSGWALVRR